MKKPKIAIVGLGNWGKKVLNEFCKLSDVAYCCTTGSKSNREWLRVHYPDIKYTADYNKILEDKSVVAVAILTPINTHFLLAKKALLAKKHVFLEKPATTKTDELVQLEDLAQKTKRLLFVDHVFAYHPNFSRLKKELKNKKIISINIKWEKYGTFNEDILWNLAYHDFYLIYELVNTIDLDFFNKKVLSKNKIDLSFKTKSGESIAIYINRESPKKSKIFLVKTLNGEYECSLLDKTQVQPLFLMIKDFLELIAKEKSGINTNLALKTVELIEALNKT